MLNPPAYVPFYAEPKVALYALSFSNTFANVETSFGNDDIVFQYFDTTAAAYKEVSFKIKTGNYNRSDLEIAIAQGLKNDSDCWRELTAVAKTVTLGVMPGCALDFELSRASGRSITRESESSRRLRQFDPVGTGFQLSTPHSVAVTPNRQADTTFST
eukprot:COSAG05_NODE_1681_length_4286_cov_32.661810_3_plen_158_part_00